MSSYGDKLDSGFSEPGFWESPALSFSFLIIFSKGAIFSGEAGLLDVEDTTTGSVFFLSHVFVSFFLFPPPDIVITYHFFYLPTFTQLGHRIVDLVWRYGLAHNFFLPCIKERKTNFLSGVNFFSVFFTVVFPAATFCDFCNCR